MFYFWSHIHKQPLSAKTTEPFVKTTFPCAAVYRSRQLRAAAFSRYFAAEITFRTQIFCSPI